MSAGRRLAGRALWNVTDQALSSITNAAASLVAAMVLSAEGFGYVAIALTVATLLLQLLRPVVSQPLLLVASATEGRTFAGYARAALGAGSALGFACGVVVAGCGLVLGGSCGSALVAAGVVLPGLFLQDTLRYVAFASGRPQRAALSDFVWLIGLALVVVCARQAPPWVYVLAWGAPATVGGLVALAQARLVPDLRNGPDWIRQHRAVSWPLFVEIAAAVGSVQAAVLLVSATSGASAAGAFRAAQTLLGPVNVLGMAGVAFLVPELVRRPTLSPAARLRAAAGLSAVLAAANLLCGLVLLSIPDSWGERVLGATWQEASGVLLPFALWSAAVALTLGPFTVLQAIGRARTAARCSLLLFPLVMVGTCAGLILGGVEGAAFGIAVAQVLTLGAWWPALARAVRESEVPGDGVQEVPELGDLIR